MRLTPVEVLQVLILKHYFFINIVWDHRMSRGSCQDSRWNWWRTKFCFWTHLPVGSSPSSCKEYWKVTIMMISLEGKNSALVFWKTDIFATSHCTPVNVVMKCNLFMCICLQSSWSVWCWFVQQTSWYIPWTSSTREGCGWTYWLF